MYWSGDLSIILPTIPKPSVAAFPDGTPLNPALRPSYGPLESIAFEPVLYDNFTTTNPAVSFSNFVTLASKKACAGTFATTALLNFTVGSCLEVWGHMVQAAAYGANATIGDPHGIPNFQDEAKAVAQILDNTANDPRTPQYDANTFLDAVNPRAVRDAASIAVLKVNPLTPESVVTAIRRHDLREPYSNKTTEQLLRILSGNKNDLLADSLRAIIFGKTTPSTGEIQAGYCKCDDDNNDGEPDWSGKKCDLPRDGLCECDSTFKSTCTSALITGCKPYVTCAGYDPIIALLQAAPALGLDVSDYKNFPEEIQVAAGMTYAPTKVGFAILKECQAFVPCMEQSFLVLNTPDDATYQQLIYDGGWSIALATDLGTTDGAGVSQEYRASYLISVLAVTANVSAAAASAKTTTSGTWAGVLTSGPPNAMTAANWTALLACAATSDLLTCAKTQVYFNVTTNLNTYCPDRVNLQNITGLRTPMDYFRCYVENQQSTLANFPVRGAESRAIWPNHLDGGWSASRTAACALAPVKASHLLATDCMGALGDLVMLSAHQVFAKNTDIAKMIWGTATAVPVNVTVVFPPAEFAALGQSLATIVGNTTFMSDVVPVSSIYSFPPQTTFKDQANAILDQECQVASALPPTNVFIADCLTLFNNLGGATQQDKTAIMAISKGLAKYTFIGAILGPCDQKVLGLSVLGGGSCWSDDECRVTGQIDRHATCDNLTNAVPFTSIEALGAVIFTNSPEGLQAKLRSPEAAKYRQIANAKFLKNYNDSLAASSRRQLDALVEPTGPLASFGDLGQHNVSHDEAVEIITQWRLKFMDAINKKAVIPASGQVVALSTDAPSQLLGDLSAGNIGLIILGYVLMIFYAILSLAAWSTDKVKMLNRSRSLVGACSILLIATSVGSGLAISLMLGFEFSAAATQILPFVMLGLGVDDVFVFIRTFPQYREGVSAQEAAAQALAISGPSMTLTSFTNAGVFACTVLTGMPVVVNMSVQAAITVITNYFTVILALPVILSWDYQRQARGLADCAVCVPVGTYVAPEKTAAENEQTVERNCMNRTFVPIYSRFLTSIPGRIFGVIVTTAFVTAGVIGVETSELGLQLSDVAPAGSALQKALVYRDQQFSFYQVSVGLVEADYSTQEVQQGMKVLWDEMNDLPHILKDSGTVWMVAFMAWGLAPTPKYSLNTDSRACDLDSPTTAGECGYKYNCTVITEDESVVAAKIPFYPQKDFYRCLNLWINKDLVYEVLQPGFVLVDPEAPRGARVLVLNTHDNNGTNVTTMPWANGGFFANNLGKNSDYVELINQVRATANSTTTPPSFAYGDPITYWDQYTDLRQVI